MFLRNLMDKHETSQKFTCTELFMNYEVECEDFLSSIIISPETQVHHYDVKPRQRLCMQKHN
jgi:hypothetical protein